MLPDLRFVLGALMVVAVTGMIGVGLFVSAKLFHQAKTGPLDSRHTPAFAGGAEWNQFYDAGSVRRYVGLARQGETREIADLPPEHQLQEATPAPPLIALAPAELPEQESGTEAMPLAVRTPIAESATIAVVPPVERMSTVAVPSKPDQAREAPIAERTAVVDADAAADIKPRPSETVVAHAVLMPIGIAPSADAQSPPAGGHIPGSTEADIVATDPENRRNPERPDTMPGTTGVNEPGAVAWKVDTALAATAETALPAPMVPPPPAAHPQAALAKAVAPPPRAPVRRAAREDDDDDRPRASAPRPPALASRPKTVPHAYGAQGNAARGNVSRRADPRQYPAGQPVFGPHFPYATPQSGQPHFGPHFPYATPQASRRAAARAPRQPAYGWR